MNEQIAHCDTDYSNGAHLVDEMRELVFIRSLAASQRQLYVYISKRVSSPSDADDVLQDTNLILWSKAADFRPGTRFSTWACRVASYEVLEYYRQRRLSHHVARDKALLACLAREPDDRSLDERRLCALRSCLDRMGERNRHLLQRFYFDEWSQREIACERGQSEVAIRVAMHHIRISLLESINRTLSEGDWPVAI